jgi:hypothetical protein
MKQINEKGNTSNYEGNLQQLRHSKLLSENDIDFLLDTDGDLIKERSYSERDLRESFKQSRQCKIFEKDMPPVYNDFEEWFEQFKNK